MVAAAAATAMLATPTLAGEIYRVQGDADSGSVRMQNDKGGYTKYKYTKTGDCKYKLKSDLGAKVGKGMKKKMKQLLCDLNGDEWRAQDLWLQFLGDGFAHFTLRDDMKWQALNVSEDDLAMDINDDGEHDDTLHVILNRNTTYLGYIVPVPVMLDEIREAFEGDGYFDYEGVEYTAIIGFSIEIDGTIWTYNGGLLGWSNDDPNDMSNM